MARAFTQWSPDTCGCVLQYYNDDQTHHDTVQACAKHAPHGNSQAHLDAVFTHNRRKNFVYADLAQRVIGRATALDRALPTYTDEQGKVFPRATLQYDPNAPAGSDPLKVTIQGITVAQRDQLQSACDTKFGAGLVLIIAV